MKGTKEDVTMSLFVGNFIVYIKILKNLENSYQNEEVNLARSQGKELLGTK